MKSHDAKCGIAVLRELVRARTPLSRLSIGEMEGKADKKREEDFPLSQTYKSGNCLPDPQLFGNYL